VFKYSITELGTLSTVLGHIDNTTWMSTTLKSMLLVLLTE